MSAISTHVLDIAAGCPAAGMRVWLERVEDRAPGAPATAPAPAATELAAGATDADGRVAGLGPEVIEPGTYRLTFDTGGYLARQRAGRDGDAGTAAFFPQVTITFAVADGREHYHVPLLLSPFGYSTYRGS
jgi:5-hydroxyisourate hydrolase